MSVLVVGLSHRSASVGLLERVALDNTSAAKLAFDVLQGPHVDEAVVLSTCNRVEVYADVGKFHGGVADISELLARHSGADLEELTPHLYVHYEDRAVQHVFAVVCGLDSMVVGETQILGQVKSALRAAQEAGTVGRYLNELFQQALRVGKRAHAETGIDMAGRSLVGVGLELVRQSLGQLSGRAALVVGAGSMSALAAASLRRAGIDDLVIVNRTALAGARLAAQVGGRSLPMDELGSALAAADVVVSCTGALGIVVPADLVAQGRLAAGGREQVFLDLALPRDVAGEVRDIEGCTVVDLERLAGILADDEGLADEEGAGRYAADVESVRAIVAAEVLAFVGWQRAVSVAPTVVALRSMAADVVDAELSRLAGRLPDLESDARREVSLTVRRVVDKLLHAPTVRVKQWATDPSGPSYAEALRELFGLDPAAIEAVSRVDLVDLDVDRGPAGPAADGGAR